MTDVRKELTYDNANNLTFGIGKPRLSIKIDQATQTNEENYTYLGEDFLLLLIVLVFKFKTYSAYIGGDGVYYLFSFIKFI